MSRIRKALNRSEDQIPQAPMQSELDDVALPSQFYDAEAMRLAGAKIPTIEEQALEEPLIDPIQSGVDIATLGGSMAARNALGAARNLAVNEAKRGSKREIQNQDRMLVKGVTERRNTLEPQKMGSAQERAARLEALDRMKGMPENKLDMSGQPLANQEKGRDIARQEKLSVQKAAQQQRTAEMNAELQAWNEKLGRHTARKTLP